MKATKQLIKEHEAVIIMLRILENIIANLANGYGPKIDELDSIIDFLKGFVDKCHHGKEEDILFPELELRGVPKADGPLGVMLSEHQQGRSLIREMDEALKALKNPGHSESMGQLTQNAQKYIALLREHIVKENEVLFKMADALLDEITQNDLYEKFEELENVRMGPGQHEAYHRLLHQMAQKYIP